jgi:uncharacterized protein (TIGR02391 family)
MVDEETIRQQARQALDRLDVEDTDSAQVARDIQAEMWRFRQPRSKVLYLEEALHYVQAAFDRHLPVCTHKELCLLNKSFESTVFFLQQELDSLPRIGVNEPSAPEHKHNIVTVLPASITHLHPAVQQAIGTRFADGYYPDALHKACTALEKAVQNKAQQPAEPTGATLMSKVFSKDKPLLTVSSNQGEQEGYMFLYRGLAQAIRNHYAHNDTAIDPARALEWLAFLSALFYKLDEAQRTTAPAIL